MTDYNGAFYINQASLDYVRGTTFDFRKYQLAVWDVVPEDESGDRGRFLQYMGTRYDHAFHGQADQRGKTNYLVEVSGRPAHDVGHHLITREMRIKRVDIQVTVYAPEWYSARELKDAMKFGVWPRQAREVGLLEKESDTVEVGDRSSDRYIRIYEKGANWLRFEVEYKHARALRFAEMFRRGGGKEILSGVIAHELDLLPESPVKDLFMSAIDEPDAIPVKVPAVDANKIRRLKWIASLLPTIRKAMRDDDIGFRVQGWFMDIIDEVDNEKW